MHFSSSRFLLRREKPVAENFPLNVVWTVHLNKLRRMEIIIMRQMHYNRLGARIFVNPWIDWVFSSWFIKRHLFFNKNIKFSCEKSFLSGTHFLLMRLIWKNRRNIAPGAFIHYSEVNVSARYGDAWEIILKLYTTMGLNIFIPHSSRKYLRCTWYESDFPLILFMACPWLIRRRKHRMRYRAWNMC